MGQVLAKDLRLAQNVHLSPQATFFVQVFGCVVGALFNYVMMLTYDPNILPSFPISDTILQNRSISGRGTRVY